MKTRNWHWFKGGFTLVEIVAVLAVVSVLASAGYYTASTVHETARENKLESDVVTLNSAVQIYESIGGDISDLSGAAGGTPEEKVLTKLKVKGDDEARSKFNGISGSLVDPRLTSGDVVSSGKRARWNTTTKRFEVVTSGGSGVREFVFSDAAADAARALSPNNAAYLRDDRAMNAANVKDGKAVWVWDFTQATASTPAPDPNPSGSPGSTPTPAATVEPIPSATPAPTATATPNVSATPTPTPTATPAPVGGGSALPAGALVAFAELQNNVQFNGNVILAGQSPQSNITLFGNSRVNGNLYLPGTPAIYKDHVASSQWDNQLWSPATDANFSNYVLGKQYTDKGVEVVPPTESAGPRVIDLDGNPEPSNYYLLIQDSAKVAGKIYRRSIPVSLPTVSAPPPKANNLSRQYHSWTLSPSNPSAYSTTVDPAEAASFSLTTNATLTLKPGNYGTVTASNNGKLVLGDAQNPNNVQYYSFESLQVNGGAGVEIVGKVVITLNYSAGNSTLRVDNNGYFGNPAHPEWLQLNVYSSAAPSQSVQQVLIASSSSFYGQINAPKGLVTIQENTNFVGSVTAYKLQMTGSAGVNVNFNLSPISN